MEERKPIMNETVDLLEPSQKRKKKNAWSSHHKSEAGKVSRLILSKRNNKNQYRNENHTRDLRLDRSNNHSNNQIQKSHHPKGSEVTPIEGSRKLTKQERRNRNRLLKAQTKPGKELTTPTNPLLVGEDEHEEESVEQGGLLPNSVVSSVYKRANVFPKSYTSEATANLTTLIANKHPEFQNILQTSYQGLHIDPVSAFPSPVFSLEFRSALRELDLADIYQFDYTQPAGLGTKIARTFVTRCLLGDPGITYKYLGLRMFAHPWTEGAVGATEATVKVGRLNQQLIQRSETINKSSGKSEYGSSKFNLTLINRCFAANQEEVLLKLEPMFGKDYCSVSWHADSSLDHFSTIAVYHFHEDPLIIGSKEWRNDRHEKKHAKKEKQAQLSITSTTAKARPWKIALRVTANAEGPNQGKPLPPNIEVTAPPVVVELPKECIYYLLDDFNHHHQHAVVAGDSVRYASTHRVSRCEGHTFQYILKKGENILNQKFNLQEKKNYIRKLLLVSIEIEFEWIRQFYIQGERHYTLHRWWHEPMTQLLNLFHQIEQKLIKIYQILQYAANGPDRDTVADSERSEKKSKGLKAKYRSLVTKVTVTSFDEFIELFQERCEKRKGWTAREQEPIFLTVPVGDQPLPCPLDNPETDLWSEVEFEKGKKRKTGEDTNSESILRSLLELREKFLSK